MGKPAGFPARKGKRSGALCRSGYRPAAKPEPGHRHDPSSDGTWTQPGV